MQKRIIVFSIIFGISFVLIYYTLLSNDKLSEFSDSQKLTTPSSEKLDNQITWDRVVEDSKHSWDGLIAIRDSFSPEGVDLTAYYNAETGAIVPHLRFALLDASIWMYLITQDEVYLEQARKVAG